MGNSLEVVFAKKNPAFVVFCPLLPKKLSHSNEKAKFSPFQKLVDISHLLLFHL